MLVLVSWFQFARHNRYQILMNIAIACYRYCNTTSKGAILYILIFNERSTPDPTATDVTQSYPVARSMSWVCISIWIYLWKPMPDEVSLCHRLTNNQTFYCNTCSSTLCPHVHMHVHVYTSRCGNTIHVCVSRVPVPYIGSLLVALALTMGTVFQLECQNYSGTCSVYRRDVT